MKHILLSILFITLLFCSCAPRTYIIKPIKSSGSNIQGTYFDIDMVNKIEDGKTTLSDVEVIFGKPFTINTDGTRLVHIYFYTETISSSETVLYSISLKMDGFTRTLSVIYDKNDIVEKHNFSEIPMKVDIKGN